MNYNDFDFEIFQKIILDISSKIDMLTPEIYMLKYNISSEKYKQICDLVYSSLSKNEDYTQVYHSIKTILDDQFFNHEKYNELLKAFKQGFEINKICDGRLYVNLCSWIEKSNLDIAHNE